MNLKDVKRLLNAEICCGSNRLEEKVEGICGSDMMSDVLAGNEQKAMLMTGLVNVQVIRTAEMLDMFCIVFVRSKHPTPQMIEMAEESGMVVMTTDMKMFESCGLLYTFLRDESEAKNV